MKKLLALLMCMMPYVFGGNYESFKDALEAGNDTVVSKWLSKPDNTITKEQYQVVTKRVQKRIQELKEGGTFSAKDYVRLGVDAGVFTTCGLISLVFGIYGLLDDTDEDEAVISLVSSLFSLPGIVYAGIDIYDVLKNPSKFKLLRKYLAIKYYLDSAKVQDSVKGK